MGNKNGKPLAGAEVKQGKRVNDEKSVVADALTSAAFDSLAKSRSTLSKFAIQELFGGGSLADLLLYVVAGESSAGQKDEESAEISKTDFVQELRPLLSYGEVEFDSFLFSTLLRRARLQNVPVDEKLAVVRDLIRVCSETYHVDFGRDDEVVVSAISSSVSNCAGDDDEFCEQLHTWKDQCLPKLTASISPFVWAKLSEKPIPNMEPLCGSFALTPLEEMLLRCALPDSFFTVASSPSADQIFAGHHTAAYVKKSFNLLYSSGIDGLSINRFENKVLGYAGPTVLLVRMNGDDFYCLAVDQEWRNSPKPWGGSDATVVHLRPKFAVRRHLTSGIYFNTKARSLFRGLRAGPLTSGWLLEFDAALMSIDELFVFGCGSSRSLAVQADQKAWEARETERMRKVPRSDAGWDDNPDKQILELAGVTVEHAQR